MSHVRFAKKVLPRAEYLRKVYHFGFDAFEDWEWLADILGPNQLSAPKPGGLGRIKLEWLRASLRPKDVCTIQVEGVQPGGGAAEDTVGHDNFMTFEVLNTAPHKQKTVRQKRRRAKQANDDGDHEDPTGFPCLIQHLHARQPSGPYPLPLYDVHAGESGVTPVLRLAPWKFLRTDLMRWNAVDSQEPGCLYRLTDRAQVVPAITDIDGNNRPLIYMREELKKGRAWTGGRPMSLPHIKDEDPATAKQLCALYFEGRKQYYRSLLKLEDLFGKGLTSLPADQKEGYYVCVCGVDKPQDVPLNLSLIHI